MLIRVLLPLSNFRSLCSHSGYNFFLFICGVWGGRCEGGRKDCCFLLLFSMIRSKQMQLQSWIWIMIQISPECFLSQQTILLWCLKFSNYFKCMYRFSNVCMEACQCKFQLLVIKYKKGTHASIKSNKHSLQVLDPELLKVLSVM